MAGTVSKQKFVRWQEIQNDLQRIENMILKRRYGKRGNLALKILHKLLVLQSESLEQGGF